MTLRSNPGSIGPNRMDRRVKDLTFGEHVGNFMRRGVAPTATFFVVARCLDGMDLEAPSHAADYFTAGMALNGLVTGVTALMADRLGVPPGPAGKVGMVAGWLSTAVTTAIGFKTGMIQGDAEFGSYVAGGAMISPMVGLGTQLAETHRRSHGR